GGGVAGAGVVAGLEVVVAARRGGLAVGRALPRHLGGRRRRAGGVLVEVVEQARPRGLVGRDVTGVHVLLTSGGDGLGPLQGRRRHGRVVAELREHALGVHRDRARPVGGVTRRRLVA